MTEQELYQLIRDALDDRDTILSWRIREAFQKAIYDQPLVPPAWVDEIKIAESENGG